MVSRRILFAGLVLVGAAFVTIVTLNAVDYYRFHRVIDRLEHLSEAQLHALGDAAAKVTKSTSEANPAGFEALGPIKSASLWPNNSDFLLYELRPWRPRFEDDRIYLYVRISTSPSNQEIIYFTNSEGKQRTKLLWNRNPAFVQKHSPGNRVLTVSQWSMSDSLSWIVLQDRILIISDSGRTGAEPSLIGEAPLDKSALNRIEEALAGLPTSARGKIYQAKGVSDGVSVHISSDPNGKERADDVTISNTWVEEFRPLLMAVSELGPKGHPIPFIEWVTTEEHLREYPTTVRTKAEQDQRDWGEPSIPWWCVWRKWLK